MEKLHEYLKRIRIDAGETGESLAQKLNYTQSYICKIEGGGRDISSISRKKLSEWCKACGVEFNNDIKNTFKEEYKKILIKDVAKSIEANPERLLNFTIEDLDYIMDAEEQTNNLGYEEEL